MLEVKDISVGLDIGGTKIAVLVADQGGCVLAQTTQPTNVTNPDHLLANITEAINAALQEAGVTARRIQGIGVGVPGQVEPATGLVNLAVNLNLKAFPLGSAIAARFNAATFIENDVRTATIGAFDYLQQAEKIEHMAYLSVGTGLAAGVVINGRLHRGYNGMAGEIGHMIADPSGELCNCGQRGCLETIVAGPAILRQIANADPQLAVNHAGDVYQAARAGHPAANTVIGHVSSYLARAVQWLIMTYDVEKIAIGGGVSHSGQAFLAPILKEMALLREQSSLAALLLLDQKLHLMPPDYNAGLWGAVRLVKQTIN